MSIGPITTTAFPTTAELDKAELTRDTRQATVEASRQAAAVQEEQVARNPTSTLGSVVDMYL